MADNKGNPVGIGLLGNALLGLLGTALSALAGVLYDILVFPMAALVHSAVKHVPVVGPTLVSVLDQWLARLSEDWPDKLP